MPFIDQPVIVGGLYRYYKTGQLNEKSDIYSFGVVLLEIITGRNALEKNTEPEVKFIGDWVSKFFFPDSDPIKFLKSLF